MNAAFLSFGQSVFGAVENIFGLKQARETRNARGAIGINTLDAQARFRSLGQPLLRHTTYARSICLCLYVISCWSAGLAQCCCGCIYLPKCCTRDKRWLSSVVVPMERREEGSNNTSKTKHYSHTHTRSDADQNHDLADLACCER